MQPSQTISIASPKLKNRYRSSTAALYAARVRSRPSSALTSISRLEWGKWKLVNKPSTTRHR